MVLECAEGSGLDWFQIKGVTTQDLSVQYNKNKEWQKDKRC